MTAGEWAARAAALLLAAFVGAGVYAASADGGEKGLPLLSADDIGFAQDMTAHHQQAVTMTDMLTGDLPPPIDAMAEQIRFTQLAEIGQMTGWLQLVGAPPAGTQPMAWMTGAHENHHAMEMPGMASPRDLARLQTSIGATQQELFLQLMIRHHQGGITMAGHATRTTTNDTVRRTASIMVAEQTEDIQVMTVLLDRLQQKS